MEINNTSDGLTLDYKVPVVVADGSLVLTKNGHFELAFLQFNQLNQPTAQVVASVRLANSEALRDLKRVIEEHLDKEDNQEK